MEPGAVAVVLISMPQVTKSLAPFVQVTGTFFRAVADWPKVDPIAGSIAEGRYSRADQKTLYVSSSAEGVLAAMEDHPLPDGETRSIWSLFVDAGRIADLRDDAVFQAIGMRREDALRPWRDRLAQGLEPSSWAVRSGLEQMGAEGLIDPSRKAPGLWHLVLFRWNGENAAKVRVARRF
jgi:RES domain-containing protein